MRQRFRNWSKYLLAYLGWVSFIGLGFLFLILGRNGLSGLLTTYYVQNKYQRSVEAQLYDRVFFLLVAFALLIGMIVVEEYFRNGVKRERLAGRVLRVLSIEIFLIFAAHCVLVLLYDFSSTAILLVAAELVTGAAMAWFGYRLPAK